MKYFFSLLIFTLVVSAELSAQHELPGQSAVEAVFGQSSELDFELCCFAAYGWHISPVMKHESPLSGRIESNNIAEYLLENEVVPQENEQYFELTDGRFVVVSTIDTYNKVYGRYLINHKAK